MDLLLINDLLVEMGGEREGAGKTIWDLVDWKRWRNHLSYEPTGKLV